MSDDVHRFGAGVPGDEILELLGSVFDAFRRRQGRNQHAVAGHLDQFGDAAEIVGERGPAERQAMEAEQAVHQHDRGTQFGDGHGFMVNGFAGASKRRSSESFCLIALWCSA